MDFVNPNTTHLLIRHQEIALKGKNRPEFERRLCRNISRCIEGVGTVNVVSGRIVVQLQPQAEPSTLLRTIDRLSQLGGVAAVTPCAVLPNDFETLADHALNWFEKDAERYPEAQTFAVRARRVNKRFPLSSAEVEIRIGSQIRNLKQEFSVKLKKPDLKLQIEIRDKHALIYSHEKAGVCGLPMDPNQRVVCLLSGGIDSPVAAYELMRRGCSPILVHFHSKPYTSEESISKVKRIAALLRQQSPLPIELWLVSLLQIQKAVRDLCNERYRTIHYRRYMVRIAEELALRQNAKALVTGDALGQVASQTLSNIAAIEDATRLPILRPLITLDKDQIIAKAQAIGTYETSIEPHDDSCILFAPNRPATQAKIYQLLEEEQLLPSYELIFSALDSAEKIVI